MAHQSRFCICSVREFPECQNWVEAAAALFFQIVREKKKRKKSDPRQLGTTWVLLKQEAEVHFLSWFLLLYTVLLLLEGRRDKCEDIAAKFHMLGKMGEVAEVAAAGVFLCSRDAGFITGKKETKHYFSLQQSINWRQLTTLRKLPKKSHSGHFWREHSNG